ncbi:hypothetical protein EVG20_g6623 [Dentipellis fragilis]|uniref:Oxidase ustYa n=1 Tax=Dentipellis fragilis TaxID=205917 RepID=A0A4Y9YJG1_9AGAM|nr:hypothetical protein EVG20_g6623 [Dentipellis fragilis]
MNRSQSNAHAFAFTLTILCTASFILTHCLFLVVREIKLSTPPLLSNTEHFSEYSYQGDNYPIMFPLDFGQAVRMVMEESVHYGVDDQGSLDEWLQIPPYGGGVFRVGPKQRSFAMSMFHRVHCLRYIRSALMEVGLGEGHLQHCLVSLSQMSLCRSDLTLEPGDFTTRNFTEDAVGATHVCRDWEAVYRMATENWKFWYKYADEHNLIPASYEDTK